MIPESVRIFVCTDPVDMRRSFDGLAYAVESMLQKDPRSGSLFAFINKRKNRLKILWWDAHGYCLLSKRLHRAVFVLPQGSGQRGCTRTVNAQMLALLIAGMPTRKKRNTP